MEIQVRPSETHTTVLEEAFRLLRALYNECPRGYVVEKMMEDSKFRSQVWGVISTDVARAFNLRMEVRNFLDRWEARI